MFVKSGMPLNARRIAQILGVTQPAVSKALPSLAEKDLIKVSKDKESKRLSIELKRENLHVLWLKRADNLKQIYESGLVQELYDSFRGATVILFGSYAFGEDTVKSDIDIAIIGHRQKHFDMSGFSSALGRELDYYPTWNSMDRHLRNNILNGITLKGAVEL
jgi:predicted nucleotidyltransferase